MSEKYMYLRMTKKWGESNVGDVVRFGWSKGLERIAAAEGVRVNKPKEVETATLDIKAKADAKAKAKAEADERAKAKAERKAKSEKAKAEKGG